MNKRVRLLLFVFITLFINPLHLLAQKDFKPRFVVTQKGDTLRGLVSAHLNKPLSVFYKPGINSQIQSIDPNDVLDIHLAKNSYRRYAGKITHDYINQASLARSRGRDTTYIVDTIFVKALSTGNNITLYTSSDDYKTHFYYSDNDQKMPLELIYRLYDDGNHADEYKNIGRTVNENTYMQQLFALAVKYNALTDKFQAQLDWARYDKAYLIPIVNKINGIK